MDSNSDTANNTIGSRYRRIVSHPYATLLVVSLTLLSDTLVYGIIIPALPDILQKQWHLTKRYNGLLFGAFGLGVLVGAPLSAIISDRRSIRKELIAVGLLGLALASGVFSIATAFWQLMVARLFMGLSSGVAWSVGLGLLAHTFPKERMGPAMGTASSAYTLGFLGGPVVGGYLYNIGGLKIIASFIAVIAGINLVALFILKESTSVSFSRENSSTLLEAGDEPSSSDQARSNEHTPLLLGQKQSSQQQSPSATDGQNARPSPTTSMVSVASSATNKASFRSLVSDPVVLFCLFVTIVESGCVGSLEPVLPLHLSQKYDLSPGTIGWIFMFLVIPGIVAGPVLGALSDNPTILRFMGSYGRYGIVGISCLVAGIAFCLVGISGNIVVTEIFLACTGFAASASMIPIMSSLGARAEVAESSNAYIHIYALWNMSYSLGVFLFPPLASLCFAELGFAWTCAMLGAFMFLCGVLVFLTMASRGSL